MNEDLKRKSHFPNLDGLRLVGSVILIVLHIEELKVVDGREYASWIKPYLRLGGIDVSLFFVLSGFLIGYLLLKEKRVSGTINIKKYYARRALRIWPLYYLVIFLGFFLFPYIAARWNIPDAAIDSPYKRVDFIMCLLFLPPYGIILKTIGATWSVRVEEVFYLMEPFLLKRAKNYIKAFLSVVIIVVLIRNGYLIICHVFNLSAWMRHFQIIISFYRISCMAIGGIGAYLLLEGKEKFLKTIYRKDLQWAVYIFVALLLVINIRIPYIEPEFYSVLFCFMIINLAANPNSIIRLDFKWMNYLGKVSYGLYLYGAIMRVFCLAFTEKIYGHELAGWQMNTVLYCTTFASTIIISIISYQYFEKPFLRLKNRFEVVKTES